MWLLWPLRRPGRPRKALAEYLAVGRATGYHLCEKVRVRSPWYRTRLPPPADGFLSGMSPASPWLSLTEDLATMAADGYVSIVGRIKDVIIRGGENIAPREVEEFLHAHPAVSEAQVIGVPSPRYGEEVMAWVRLKPGGRVTADELEAYCRGRIAGFMVPRYGKFVAEFPTTVTGKVQKFRMREMAVAELGLAAAADTA